MCRYTSKAAKAAPAFQQPHRGKRKREASAGGSSATAAAAGVPPVTAGPSAAAPTNAAGPRRRRAAVAGKAKAEPVSDDSSGEALDEEALAALRVAERVEREESALEFVGPMHPW